MNTNIIEATQDCPTCGGYGCVEDSEMACCGNVSDSGECRSHCVIEQLVQIGFPACRGSGKL